MKQRELMLCEKNLFNCIIAVILVSISSEQTPDAHVGKQFLFLRNPAAHYSKFDVLQYNSLRMTLSKFGSGC